MSKMKKYSFDLDTRNVWEIIGIDEPKMDFFIKQAKVAYHSNELQGCMMEDYMNAVQPTNEVEAFFAGMVFGQILQEEIIVQENPLLNLLRSMRNED